MSVLFYWRSKCQFFSEVRCQEFRKFGGSTNYRNIGVHDVIDSILQYRYCWAVKPGGDFGGKFLMWGGMLWP